MLKTYSLIWEVNGIKKETLISNVSYVIARHTKIQKQHNYTYGKLKIIKL